MKLMEYFKGRRGEMKKLDQRMVQGKHKYVYFFNKDLEKKFLNLFKSYPKRAGSRDNAASGFQPEEGGVNPTPALQNQSVSDSS